MLLNNQWVKKERRTSKIPETNENKNTTYQKLQDAAKAVLTGNVIAV